jgi:hypothetical protein
MGGFPVILGAQVGCRRRLGQMRKKSFSKNLRQE